MQKRYVGSTIISVPEVQSTNLYAISQLSDKEVEPGTVFLTYNQTAGRGQLNNQWESEKGKNLTFSIFIKPSVVEIQKQFMISKVVSLGVVSFLNDYVDDIYIKWPNDIYVGDHKICGILIENAVMQKNIFWSVVGIGLNINQTAFLSDAPNPVSMKKITGKDYDLTKMLDALLNKMDFYYQKLIDGKYDDLDMRFLKYLYRINEWCDYKDENHQYKGKIVGVNDIGQLQIEEVTGKVNTYNFKEVKFL
ncbi:MAG: biotin--[acetyl-CoA-carboxylase] ligase [Prolixibacteraceae bacterium]|nr:biotin--[acetyl-CoA-carboxylase] ligase [Prolixibacteraceae bacterium]